MKFLLVIAALISCMAVMECAFTAESKCGRDGDKRYMTITFAKENNDDPDILGFYDNGGQACNGVNYNAGNALDPGITLTLADPDPAATLDGCGVGSTGDEFTVTLRTASLSANVHSPSDREFIAVCDFANVKNEMFSGEITAGDLATSSVTTTEEDVSITLHESDGKPATTCPLDSQVHMRATLIPSDTAKAISVKACKVFSAAPTNGVATPNATIIGDDGCGQLILANTDSFQRDPVSTPTEYIAKTANFNCLKFPTSNDLVFRCTITYEMDENYTGPQCPPPGRKRRAADTPDKEVADTPPEEYAGFVVRVVGTSDVDQRVLQQCNNKTYIIGLAVLGVVLALMFIVTIGMFFIISRQRHPADSPNVGFVNKGCA